MKSNLAQQTKTDNQEFLIGDVVVLAKPHYTTDSSELFTIEDFHSNLEMFSIESLSYLLHVFAGEIRPATVAELNAKRRLKASELSIAEVS